VARGSDRSGEWNAGRKSNFCAQANHSGVRMGIATAEIDIKI